MKRRDDLGSEVSDAARKVVVVNGGDVIVPLKFDEDGNLASVDSLIFKRLSIMDLRFLGELRRLDWDVDKARLAVGVDRGRAERLVKKLSCFRAEEARVRALCEIPTPEWIAAKHVENVYHPTLKESQHKSLAELAKIEGAYKNNLNVSVTQNIFDLPRYDAATEIKLKAMADQEAMLIQEAQVVNG